MTWISKDNVLGDSMVIYLIPKLFSISTYFWNRVHIKSKVGTKNSLEDSINFQFVKTNELNRMSTVSITGRNNQLPKSKIHGMTVYQL